MPRTVRKRPAAIERVGGIVSRDDRRQATHAFARAFANPSWMENHMDHALFCAPIFKPEHTRVAVVGGQVAAAVTMAPRTIWFGSVKVPAMTVGPVGTHDHYRKRGYASAAMNDAIAYMAENGYLVAYLQGIPDFYYRFGYYPYAAPSSAKVKRKDLQKEARPGRMRAMKRDDLPAVRRLYDSVTAGRTCACARDAAVWEWLIGPGTRTWLFHKPRLILDARGRLCGYLTLGGQMHKRHGEILVRPDEGSCRAALGALLRDARRRDLAEVSLPLPWDDPFGRFVRQFVQAEWKLSTYPTGGSLMAIVDFPALMRRLQPLFEERRRRAGAALPEARFTFASEIGKVGIAVTRDGVRVEEPGPGPQVKVPRRWLSGLLTGYYSVADVAARKGASFPAAVRAHVEVLFPAGWPFVYQGDNY